MTTSATVRTWVTEGRHRVYWMSTGTLTLGAVPALGGRLLSVQAAGRELIWRNPALLTAELQPVPGHVPAPAGGTLGDWCNYGGDKTWPAPQGWSSPREWAGPPDPVLDSGPYEAHLTAGAGSATLTMTSQSDPRTGLRLTRSISLDDANGFALRLSAVNTGAHEVTWALWNVTQLAGGGTVEVAVGDRFSRPVELAIGTGVPAWRRTGAQTVTIDPQDVVGKIGFPYAAGQLSYRYEDLTLTWSFPVDEDAHYPDGGSRAEVWMEHPQPAPLATLDGLDPPARIVECEVLSPSYRLAPGDVMTLDVSVTVSRTDQEQDVLCHS